MRLTAGSGPACSDPGSFLSAVDGAAVEFQVYNTTTGRFGPWQQLGKQFRAFPAMLYLNAKEPPLHYVDAYLATKGYHPRDHTQRRGFVAMESSLRPLTAPFRRLYDASLGGRYFGQSFDRAAVQRCWSDLETIKQRLKAFGVPT